jgi:hypothetical protein
MTWVFEFSVRFGREKVDNEPPEIYDLQSGQIERAPQTMGFSPNEGWEDKR